MKFDWCSSFSVQMDGASKNVFMVAMKTALKDKVSTSNFDLRSFASTQVHYDWTHVQVHWDQKHPTNSKQFSFELLLLSSVLPPFHLLHSIILLTKTTCNGNISSSNTISTPSQSHPSLSLSLSLSLVATVYWLWFYNKYFVLWTA